MYCKNCGDKVADDTKFCGGCGQKTSKEIVKEDLQRALSTSNENIKSMEPINLEKEIVKPEPVKKLKWYQKIFNWFKGK